MHIISRELPDLF